MSVTDLPESGTTGYQYDGNGNLTQRTDARGVATTYTFDWLNRVTNKSYSDGTPAVTYTYSNSSAIPYSIGRLTQITNIYGTTNYVAYDPLGRATASQQIIGGQTYTFSYGYDLSGALTSETYPSGRVITTGFDNAGRVSLVSGGYATQQKTYYSNTEYEPNGAPAWFLYGNGLCRSFGYNSRMQLANSAESVVQGAPQGSTCFNAGQQPLAITYNWADANGKNNGNLWGTTTYQNGPSFPQALSFDETFGYDNLNRITTAAGQLDGVLRWYRNFDYDQYGNMWTPANGGMNVSGLMPQTNLYTAANRRGDSAYDAAGNQLTMGGTTLMYDAENRLVSATNPPAYGGGTEAYVYDGDGRRVEKAVTGGNTEVYVHDIFGKLIAEYATNPPATAMPCGTCYISTDHLGSTRLVTGDNASIIARHDYVPFGEEIPGGYAGRTSEWGATDNVNQKFTAKERDSETGLDYFGARYMSSAQGRFTSPDEFKGGIVDPVTGQDIETNTALPYADITDPQTLNKYVYVRNNPLRYTDPNGHCIEDLCIAEGTASAAVGSVLLYYGYKLGVAIRDTLNSQYQPAPVYAASQADQGQQAQPSPGSGTGQTSPDRTANDNLRRDENGKAIPDPEAHGKAHTQLGTRDSKTQPGERYKQAREFDENGKPVRDVDFTDHGRKDHVNPHEHPYDPATGKRGSQQPLKTCGSDQQCQ